MRLTVIFTLLLLTSCVSNKLITVEKDTNAVNYANTITAKELKGHLYVFASDKFLGRETGKEGQQIAEKYLVDEFKEIGIEPGNNGSYLQSFEVVEHLRPVATIYVNGREYFNRKQFYFFSSLADFEDTTIQLKDVVDVSYGIENKELNNYKDIIVKDKIVLINVNNPEEVAPEENWNWRRKLALAQEKGAQSVFFIDEYYDQRLEVVSHYLESSTMNLLEDEDKEKGQYIPFYFVNDVLKKELLEAETDIKIDFNFRDVVLETTNVLAYVEGSDSVLKDEVIVITAHYDHIGVEGQDIYNGADDDGTGSVALLELAEAFQLAKKNGNGPKRSILIMPVSGEEKGLLGSKYYTNHPVYPLENTVANLNIDMIGRIDSTHLGDTNYLYLIGSDRISNDLHLISEAVNKAYMKLDLDYTYNKEDDPNKFYYRSDHYNFAKNRVPVIFYFSGVHEDYHKVTDTVDKIIFEKVEKAARLVFYTAWELANREERIKKNAK